MKKAFTLIELSIVLVIIAIIAGNLLTLATEKTEADKVKETEAVLDKIEQAIAQYFAEYGSIPCPGDATISQYNSSFGKATRSTNPSTCDGSGSQWYSGGSYIYFDLGVIPTKELQIPDELAFDAWGRRITYAIIEWCNSSNNQYLGSNPSILNYNYGSFYNQYFSNWCAFPNKDVASGYQSMGTFQIRDASGTINTNSGIPYVLISHGKNGHGAYPHDGGSTRINAAAQQNSTMAYNLSTDELQNAHMNPDGSNVTFAGGGSVVAGGVYVQKAHNYSPGSNYFDDIVRYKTKEQLIRSSGRFPALNTVTTSSGDYINSYSTNFCQLATTVAASPTNYCSGTCATYLGSIATQLLNLCT